VNLRDRLPGDEAEFSAKLDGRLQFLRELVIVETWQESEGKEVFLQRRARTLKQFLSEESVE
jgi:hypothetical protein